jgi:hypothetical protein
MRHGSVFTDRIILSRQAFVEQLKQGKRYLVGQRILNMGGKFNVTQPVHLVRQDGHESIVVGDAHAARDTLPGVPVV